MNSESLSIEVPQKFAATTGKETRKYIALETKVREAGDAVILECKGRLVYREEAAVLTGRVADLMADYNHVILNFAGVESIDSSGLGSLAILCQWAKSAGGTIRFCNVRPRVEGMLQLTNLSSVMQIHANEAEALAACAPALV